jgi:hypothetical protein
MNRYRKIRLFENHTKNVWVLFKKPKLVAIAAKQKKIGTRFVIVEPEETKPCGLSEI